MTYQITLKTNQAARLRYDPKDADGRPAPAVVTSVTSANEAVVKFEPDFAGQQWVSAKGVGTTVVTVSGTTNGNPLSETIEFTVVAVDAVTFGITWDIVGG